MIHKKQIVKVTTLVKEALKMKTWKANLFRLVQNRKVALYFLAARGVMLILTLTFISRIKSSVLCWQIYWFVSFLSEAVNTLSKYSENVFKKNNIVTLMMTNGTCFIYLVAMFLYPLMIWWMSLNGDAMPANLKSVLIILLLICVNWGVVYILAKKTSQYCEEEIKSKEEN